MALLKFSNCQRSLWLADEYFSMCVDNLKTKNEHIKYKSCSTLILREHAHTMAPYKFCSFSLENIKRVRL